MTDKLPEVIDRYLNHYEYLMTRFPPDGQKEVSRYYEIDCRHSHILNKLVNFTKKTKDFTSTDGERMKQMLVESLELAEKKNNISEQLLNMVGKNMINLNMNINDIQMAQSSKNKSNKITKKTGRIFKWEPGKKKIDSGSINDDLLMINNHIKRSERNKTKINESEDMAADLNGKSSTTQSIKKITSNKKSQTQRRAKNKKVISDTSSDSENDMQTTYCTCEEISYGDMVCCDNDLCPIQWFHFGCVSLIRKPKGKWYCPRCRGTNSRVMKPKEVLFRELEEYNKRKEEDW